MVPLQCGDLVRRTGGRATPRCLRTPSRVPAVVPASFRARSRLYCRTYLPPCWLLSGCTATKIPGCTAAQLGLQACAGRREECLRPGWRLQRGTSSWSGWASPSSTRPGSIRPFGMNFLSIARAVVMWSRIVQLARAGTIRPAIGRQIDFAAGLVALEWRETTGRTVVVRCREGEPAARPAPQPEMVPVRIAQCSCTRARATR